MYYLNEQVGFIPANLVSSTAQKDKIWKISWEYLNFEDLFWYLVL